MRKWLFGIPVVVAAVVFTVLFWDKIFLRVAPKAVLTKSLGEVFEALEERFEDDPLLLVYDTIQQEGKYTADVALNTENSILGPVAYQMEVQTDGAGHRIQARGSAQAADLKLDLSCYLDNSFMAVSSPSMAEGQYYGITYDTFSQDIRSIPLLSFFISDKMLQQWDSSIQTIRQQANRSYTVPQIPQLTEEDMRTLIFGILTLPCEIETTSIAAEKGPMECQAVTYSIRGEQINQLLSNTPYSSDPTVTVTFYLNERSLVKVHLTCTSGDRRIDFGLFLGKLPAENRLRLQVFRKDGEQQDSFSLSADTDRTGELYTETWGLSKDQGMGTVDTTYHVTHHPETGDTRLTINEGDPVAFRLTGTEKGFFIAVEDFRPLLDLLNRTNTGSHPVSGEIRVTKGSAISTPAYKNLDQWSLEDFWAVLSGVGSLLGIQIQ